jgi:hypothetical protein
MKIAALALVALVSGGTPTLAVSSGGCVDQPDTPALPPTPEEPADCSGNGCALPTPWRPRANTEPVIGSDISGWAVYERDREAPLMV